MEKELLENIKKNFDVMLPQNQETLLILAALQSKIENQIIEEAFTQRDFEETVDEISDLVGRQQQIQSENISKKLSQYYYTTLKRGEEYRYQLTVFATDLVQLIFNEIQPQFDNVELNHTFERTLKLTAQDLKNPKNFEYWFANHFQPSKKIILSHTENLQRLVDVKTLALRQLLKNNIENTKDLINNFIEIFEALGKQTQGLTETLMFKQEVVDNIKIAEIGFLNEKESWESYSRIRLEVEKFFDNVDLRVLSINDRIQGSTSRLKTLYDTLRHKQLFKLKLEKFLVYVLKNSKVGTEGELKLPENVPTYKMPYYKEKLVAVPNLNFSDITPREVPLMEEDPAHKALKEKANMRMLNRQESVSKWLEEMNGNFASGKNIVFDEWFKKIYKQEQNLEVPIDVCFGVIQKYGREKDVQMIIENKNPFKANEDLSLWKLKIQHLHS